MQPKPTIVKAPKGCEQWLTEGKNYKVISCGNTYLNHNGWEFEILDDDGDKIYCNTKTCGHANGDWEIVGYRTKQELQTALIIHNEMINCERIKEIEYELQCLNQYLSENQSTTYTNVVHSELEQKAITGFNKDKRFKITE